MRSVQHGHGYLVWARPEHTISQFGNRADEKGVRMAQRPGFDMSKVSTNDKILLGVTAAFLIDSFLPWQRVCVSVGALGKVCGSASAWGGSASWAGVIAGL